MSFIFFRVTESVQNTLKNYSSESYFSKYFKDSTGMGFTAYVNSIRLKHALEDIMDGNMSIADAASYNGFPSVKTFETACKRSYGLTPLQFKKQQLRVS